MTEGLLTKNETLGNIVNLKYLKTIITMQLDIIVRHIKYTW